MRRFFRCAPVGTWGFLIGASVIDMVWGVLRGGDANMLFDALFLVLAALISVSSYRSGYWAGKGDAFCEFREIAAQAMHRAKHEIETRQAGQKGTN